MNVCGTEKRDKELPDEFFVSAMYVIINWLSSWFYKVYLYFTFCYSILFVAYFLFPCFTGKGVITLYNYIPLEKTHIHKSIM